jgi:flagellar biosynthesis/type III secretory pathway chaperone
MPDNMDRLIMLLSEKEQIMEEMVRTLTEEQSRIMEMNPASVEASNRSKEEVTLRLAGVTARCRELMTVVGIERGVEPAGTLTTLIAAASENERQKLLPLQRRLLALGDVLVRQQDLNRKILLRSLGLIRQSLALFTGLLGFSDTYGAQGRVSTTSAGLSFLSREI